MLAILVTGVPQTVAALEDGPITDEQRTIRSVKRLFFLDRTLTNRFSLAAPARGMGTALGRRPLPRPADRLPTENSTHLDAHAPPPSIAWLMQILKVNLLQHSNYT